MTCRRGSAHARLEPLWGPPACNRLRWRSTRPAFWCLRLSPRLSSILRVRSAEIKIVGRMLPPPQQGESRRYSTRPKKRQGKRSWGAGHMYLQFHAAFASWRKRRGRACYCVGASTGGNNERRRGPRSRLSSKVYRVGLRQLGQDRVAARECDRAVDTWRVCWLAPSSETTLSGAREENEVLQPTPRITWGGALAEQN